MKARTKFQRTVKQWMFDHCDEFKTVTELAENAAWEWDENDTWLDDELYWIWDFALDVMNE